MCGILGSIPFTEEILLKKSLDLLSHRGPDGTGTWTSADNKVSLGHRRLSILDLSDAGTQPMHYGHYTITYNGEIYNYPELKKELQAKGYSFSTRTDTEVILAAYSQWGADCLQRFNGMWAFAIWDKKEKQLFLSRDRFGEKPLFYAFVQGQFFFASEMKALIPFLPEVRLSKNFEWMKENLFTYEPTDLCLIEGIKRFPAGHFGLLRNGELRIFKYWETLQHLHPVPKKYKEQVLEFREIFLDACRIRLRSDVPVGTSLSGGVDSSATIAGIHKAVIDNGSHVDWQNAFVACMPGSHLDETHFAKSVADHLELKAHYLLIDPVKGLQKLEEYLFQTEELYIGSPAPMMQIFDYMKANDISVSIDGHGSDEMFAGYENFFFHAFHDCGLNPFAIRNLLQTYKNLVPPFDQFRTKEIDYRDYLRWITGSSRVKDFLPRMKPELKKAFFPYQKIFPVEDISELGAFDAELYKMFHQTVLPTILRNYDRYSMAFGVEIRMPFLDHRVVAYAFSIPWTSKLRNGYTKSILRDAMGPFLPEKVIRRKYKMGFQTPVVEWLQGPWKEYFLDIVNSKDFLQTDIVDSIRVKSQIELAIYNKVLYKQAEAAYTAIQPYLWKKAVLDRFEKISTRTYETS